MFNGIIYNTGKIKYLKRGVNSTQFGIETNINFKKKDIIEAFTSTSTERVI